MLRLDIRRQALRGALHPRYHESRFNQKDRRREAKRANECDNCDNYNCDQSFEVSRLSSSTARMIAMSAVILDLPVIISTHHLLKLSTYKHTIPQHPRPPLLPNLATTSVGRISQQIILLAQWREPP